MKNLWSHILGVLFIGVIIYFGVRLLISEIEQRISSFKWKYEELLSEIYQDTGLIMLDNSLQDMLWDGRNLWASAEIPQESAIVPRKNGIVQRINPFTGKITAEVSLDGKFPASLAWDGVNLWVADRYDPIVQKIDIKELRVTQIITVSSGVSAMIWDGSNLWVACEDSKVVQQIDIQRGVVTQEIVVKYRPVDMVWANGSAWVAEEGRSDDQTREVNAIQQIDAASGKNIGEILLNYTPRSVAVARDSLWVASDRLVQKYDLTSRKLLAQVTFDGIPGKLAYDGYSLWVTNLRTNTIIQIDPHRAEVIASLPVKQAVQAITFDGTNVWVGGCSYAVGCKVQKLTPSATVVNDVPAAIAWDGSGLWVVYSRYSGYAGVQRFDPVNGKFSPEIAIRNTPSSATWDGRSLWVLDWDSSVVQQIDPQEMKVKGEVSLGDEPSAIAWDGTSLWGVNWGGLVTQIDRETRVVLAQIPLSHHANAIAWGGGYLWVTDSPDQLLYKIDPKTASIVETFSLESEPIFFAWVSDSLWIQESSHILQMDPKTGKALSTMRTCQLSILWDANNCESLPADVIPSGTCRLDISAWDGANLWVACEDSSVAQIDPKTGKILAAIQTEEPLEMAWDGLNLWVANRYTLQRIHVQSVNEIREFWMNPK